MKHLSSNHPLLVMNVMPLGCSNFTKLIFSLQNASSVKPNILVVFNIFWFLRTVHGSAMELSSPIE